MVPPVSTVGRRSLRSLSTSTPSSSSSWSFRLWGISEWRDIIFDFPESIEQEQPKGGGGDNGFLLKKEVCVLPFPYPDVLLQGETKQLRLYEDRFIKLFDDCMTNHQGVVAMGLLTGSSAAGIIQTVPLCEIEAYNRLEGFGIFVTIRAVARASLVQITQSQPYIKAVCTEIVDELPVNLELPSLVASNIESMMLLLSSMEHKLSQVSANNKNNNSQNKSFSDDDDDDDDEDDDESKEADDAEDAEMERRIAIARLEDRFYSDLNDDEDEDEDDNDEEDTEMDRRARFRKAYEIALATDTQGYAMTSSSSTSSLFGSADNQFYRTPQDLTAISWAAFGTEILPDADATFRIQALDCNKLFDRLKLALYLLRQKKDQLKAKMEKAGIQFRNNNNNNGGHNHNASSVDSDNIGGGDGEGSGDSSSQGEK